MNERGADILKISFNIFFLVIDSLDLEYILTSFLYKLYDYKKDINSDKNNPVANVLYAGKDIFSKIIIVKERITCVKIS